MLNSQIYDSNFAFAFASFRIEPLNIFEFLKFCICIPHKLWIWTSIQRAFWAGIFSFEHVEASACMNLAHFHVQVHLGPLLGLHRPRTAPIQSPLDLMASIDSLSESWLGLVPRWDRSNHMVRPNHG
jgi:hypothetical protein